MDTGWAVSPKGEPLEMYISTSYRPRAVRQYAPTPLLMAVQLAVDLRLSADGSAVRTWLSYRQPTCLQPMAAVCLGLGETDGQIAVSLNAPLRRGGIIIY